MRLWTAALSLCLLVAPNSVTPAAPPAREPLRIQEPAWKGAAPAVVTVEYRESLARLQALARDHQAGVPLRVTSPAPCTLRLERGDQVTSFADATRPFLHQVTWVDLRLGARLGAQSFGRNSGAGPAMLATCAWLEGRLGLAVSTEMIFPAGAVEPALRSLLVPQEHPRICVTNDVEPEEVAAPLRRLVEICGGKAVAIPVEPERYVSSEEAMLTAWNGSLAERVEELVHDGKEGAVLEPLSRHPVAARIMLDHFRRSDRLWERKLAPALAGRLGPEAPAGTLDELFDAEAGRRRSEAPRGPGAENARNPREATVNRTLEGLAGRPVAPDYFDAQSVVEDIVIAGRRWCGDPSRAKAGAAILRKVVERTVAGEYWDSSGPAMRGIVCDCREDARELLSRFSTFAFGRAPDAPSRPSLLGERKAVDDLRAGRCDAPFGTADAPKGDPLAGWDRRDRARLGAFLIFAESAK